MSDEGKVLFIDGDAERVIRGKLDEDEHFIYVRRRDGTIRISKTQVLKIEEWNRGECNDREE